MRDVFKQIRRLEMYCIERTEELHVHITLDIQQQKIRFHSLMYYYTLINDKIISTLYSASLGINKSIKF